MKKTKGAKKIKSNKRLRTDIAPPPRAFVGRLVGHEILTDELCTTHASGLDGLSLREQILNELVKYDCIYGERISDLAELEEKRLRVSEDIKYAKRKVLELRKELKELEKDEVRMDQASSEDCDILREFLKDETGHDCQRNHRKRTSKP